MAAVSITANIKVSYGQYKVCHGWSLNNE